MRGPSGREPFARAGAPAWALYAVALFLILPIVPGAASGTHALPPTGGAAFRSNSLGPVVGAARPTPSTAGAPTIPGAWAELTNSTLTPVPRQSGEMVYDPVSEEYVLFGGSNSATGALGDTWTFADGNWTDLSASLPTAPSPRWYASMVWDSEDGYVLLFGGRDASQDFNDTWEFNGTNWTPLFPTSAPPPLTSGRIVDDPAQGAVVLYGGYSIMAGAPSFYNFTWTYRAGNWTNVTATVTGAPPDPHVVTYAAYDPAAAVELLYGGNGTSSTNCSTPGSTWTYQNGTYTNLTATLAAAPPVALGSRMMAYDPAFGGVVLYGGWEGGSCALSDQTWVFAGGAWYNLTTAHNPGPTWDGEAAGDPMQDAVLLFSGEDPVGQSDATWNFTPELSVNVTASPLKGVAPLTVNFTSVVVGLGPLTYNWTFGDGSTNNTSGNTTHRYLAAGTYHAVLEVVDALGRSQGKLTTVQVFAVLGANATGYPSEGDAPLPVNFTARSFGGDPPVSFAWTFGDGSVGSGQAPEHTYASSGTFSWTVVATDALGQFANASGQVIVAVPLVITSLNVTPTVGVAPFVVSGNVTAANGTGPYTATWSFGDGTPTVVGASVQHTYTLAGDFHAEVSVADAAGGIVVRMFNVTSVAPMVVGIVATPTAGEAPLDVGFAAEVTGGLGPFSYSWQFGEPGAVSNGSQPSYVYDTLGNFTASVNVTDSSGQRVEGVTVISVVPPLVANLTPTSFVGIAPYAPSFTVRTSGGLAPYSVDWSFGDGTTTTAGASLSHTYARAGTYDLRATVHDSAGDAATTTALVDVVGTLSVGLAANASVIPVGSPVALVVSISGGDSPFSVNWSGLPSGCPTPPSAGLTEDCVPSQTGTFDIEVTVRDALGEMRTQNTTLIVFPGGVGTVLPSTPTPAEILGFLIVLVAVIAVALVLVRRRRQRQAQRIPDESVVIEPPAGAPQRPPPDDGPP